MPSLFDDLENEISDDVDAQFGAEWEHVPMSRATPNSRPGEDASRLRSTVVAVFDDRVPGAGSFARLGNTSGGTASPSATPQFTMTNPMLFVDARRFLYGQPRHGDRFVRADNGFVYEVAGIEPDGQGRLKMPLALVSRE